MKKIWPYLILLGLTAIFLSPILIDSRLFLARDNDLNEFFWPIYYYVKNQMISYHTFPLWNNIFLSGTPLLPDPQSPLFYLPNVLFLILPIGACFILSSFSHIFAGVIGAFLLGRELKLKTIPSLIFASLYLLTSRLPAYIEAGHFGLIMASTWIPYVFLATSKLINHRNQKLSSSILLGVSLAGLYYTHTVTFVWACVFASLVFLFFSLILHDGFELFLTKSSAFFLGALTCFGLIAVTFLPQIAWSKETIRSILLVNIQTHPTWQSLTEVLTSIFTPWYKGFAPSATIETEKWLPLGILILPLFLMGFAKQKKVVKIAVIFILAFSFFWILNNISPVFDFLTLINWFVLSRVATRLWFFTALIFSFLASLGFQELVSKKRMKLIGITLIVLTIFELLLLSWTKISQPIDTPRNLATKKVIEFIKNDQGRFRVFCITRCISQKDAALNGLELIEGYSTLIQTNYYKQAWQFTGAHWNYYTLAIPPIGTYTFEKIKPDAKSLGEYNTKYIISPYELTDTHLRFLKKIDGFYIYQNDLFLPKVYFAKDDQVNYPTAIITPNKISIKLDKEASSQLIIAEVFSPGWKAYLDNKQEVWIQQTPNSLRTVETTPQTRSVDFYYRPEGYLLGRYISATTIIMLVGYAVAVKVKPIRS